MNNSIEQKLKQDAKAFAQAPSARVYDSIQSGIENIQQTSQSKRLSHYNWLMPAGLVTAALFLVVMLNFSSINNHKPLPENSNQNVAIIKLAKIDINALTMNFETSLTNKMFAEKKALQADLNYMKNMFTL